jgi:hypothetical protein
MNAKLIGTALVLALLGSTNLFAGQPFGRDSVYATPGTYTSKSSAAAVVVRPGRSSVYASDQPAPRKSTVVNTAVIKPGRA